MSPLLIERSSPTVMSESPTAASTAPIVAVTAGIRLKKTARMKGTRITCSPVMNPALDADVNLSPVVCKKNVMKLTDPRMNPSRKTGQLYLLSRPAKTTSSAAAARAKRRKINQNRSSSLMASFTMINDIPQKTQMSTRRRSAITPFLVVIKRVPGFAQKNGASSCPVYFSQLPFPGGPAHPDAQVPISHPSRYFFCSGVRLSIFTPIDASLSRAISRSISDRHRIDVFLHMLCSSSTYSADERLVGKAHVHDGSTGCPSAAARLMSRPSPST